MWRWVVCAAALLGGCGLFGSPEVRYKITVEVDDGGTVRSGSSVWSWTLSKPTVALASPYSGKFAGEAVAVDLGDGRTLFAILRGGEGDLGAAQLLPERLFGDVGRSARGEPTRFSDDRLRDLRDIASRTGERQVLDCRSQASWCPMLVTFDDIREPTSVRKVDPLNASPALGAGHRVSRIVVEITEDPVTTGIGRTLPWLGQHPEPRLDSSYRGSTNPSLPELLSHGDFQRGGTK